MLCFFVISLWFAIEIKNVDIYIIIEWWCTLIFLVNVFFILRIYESESPYY